MLKPKDLATVTNRLQVPLIVSDILNGKGELTADAEYGIHEVISDLQPDAALLCIAISARKLAGKFSGSCPMIGILDKECAQIIEEYAEVWLRNATGREIAEEEAIEALARTAEDLEGLAELLEINAVSLGNKNKDASKLCEIMSIQAKAHALIAEAFFETIQEAEPASSGNVIQFPKTPLPKGEGGARA